MPQMKPMNWLNLMIYFMMSMLFTLTNLNFFKTKKKKKKIINNNTIMYFNFKW